MADTKLYTMQVFSSLFWIFKQILGSWDGRQQRNNTLATLATEALSYRHWTPSFWNSTGREKGKERAHNAEKFILSISHGERMEVNVSQ